MPAAALAALLVTGCSGDSGPAPPASSGASSGASSEPSSRPPSVGSYVALGDSFTAAPYVPRTDLAGGCLRSSGNYPALVAAATGARLTDVSCSSATTDDVLTGQVVGLGRGRVRAQLRAVNRGTDLVTVGIGGNDEGLFATLVGRCTSLASRSGSPCAEAVAADEQPTAAVARTGRRVAAVLRRVRRTAPAARVLLVGYPRLVDPDRGCGALPLAAGDRPFVARLERALDFALRRAAERTDAEYVEVHRASRGHEICSDDPWVNGRVTDQARALAFHPFAEEQQAVAELILASLTSP